MISSKLCGWLYMEELFKSSLDTPFGIFCFYCLRDELVWSCFVHQPGYRRIERDYRIIEGETEVSIRVRDWVFRYCQGERPNPAELPLRYISGSLFSRQVWSVLSEIPYGSTVSYGRVAATVAARLGREKMSAQAVGGAVKNNPFSLIIPCHRVIGSDGSLVGYAGGIETKIKLLKHERIELSELQSII